MICDDDEKANHPSIHPVANESFRSGGSYGISYVHTLTIVYYYYVFCPFSKWILPFIYIIKEDNFVISSYRQESFYAAGTTDGGRRRFAYSYYRVRNNNVPVAYNFIRRPRGQLFIM